MVDVDTSFPDNSIRESTRHYVNYSQLLIFFIALSRRWRDYFLQASMEWIILNPEIF
jgi:hypothetical protein